MDTRGVQKWKRRFRNVENLLEETADERDYYYEAYKQGVTEIERLNGILENMLPTGTVGGRIKQLETTNEFNTREAEYYKNMSRNFEAEVKRLTQVLIEKNQRPPLPRKSDEIRIKDLEAVILREEKIHNEAAAGMIAKVKELETKEAEQHELLARHARELESRAKKIHGLEKRIAYLEEQLKAKDMLLRASGIWTESYPVEKVKAQDSPDLDAAYVKRIKELEHQATDLQRRLDMQREANDRLRDRIGKLENALAQVRALADGVIQPPLQARFGETVVETS